MLSRISLLLVGVVLFASVTGVEAKGPQPKKIGGSGGNPFHINVGNNGGNNIKPIVNNQPGGNPVAKQIGRQILNQLIFGNGGLNGNGGWNNGNNGNCNNGNNGNCNNGNNGNCNNGNNGGPVIVPAGGQPPVVEQPPLDQPMDQPIDPTQETPMDPMQTPGTIEVGTEGGESPTALQGTAPGAISKGVDLQAKQVSFATRPSITANGKSGRILFAEVACLGNVPFNGNRTLTIEHDSAPGQQPPTIIAVAKIPAIAAGQVFKFQKDLPANFPLESLRLRLTLSPGDGNPANDSISSRE